MNKSEERRNDTDDNDAAKDDAEERMLMVQDIMQNIQNDMMGRSQEIELVQPIIENDIFFEDINQKDRLNNDIDIDDDARIRSILGSILIMDEQKFNSKVDKAFIHQIRNSELQLRMHLDGGANRSVTDDLRLLHGVRDIRDYTMHGAQKGDPTINCNKVGYIKLICKGRGVINVRTFFSPDVSETILSPGDITESSDNNYVVWEQRSDHGTGYGSINFSSRSGLQQAIVETKLINGLWYATQPLLDCIDPAYDDWMETPEAITPLLRRLTKAATHELWHQRLCHPGETVTSTINKTAEGVPNLTQGRNSFYKCASCMKAKMERTAKPTTSSVRDSPVYGPGQMFHMDFGFVRGSDFKIKEDDGRIITSRDGFNSYLIIVDRYSSYTWIMLARSKDPPIEFVKNFLHTHKDRKCPRIRVRTDQGGELWGSSDFQRTIQESQCLLEPTGAGDPAQNGKAELPNKTFGRMLRGMLYNAGLGSEYWSHALTHAVYVKNRLPHAALHMRRSPYEAYTGVKPNLSMLKVWGCKVVVKNPELRKAKLDDNTSTGIFLGYTATNKNIRYLDLTTNMEKIGSNVLFDEASFSAGAESPGAKALFKAGLNEKDAVKENNSSQMKVKKIHEDAILPKRASPSAAGIDLYTPDYFEIDGMCMKTVPIGIAVALPKGCYGRIAPRSGITIKKNIDIRAGVVDQDYRGEIIVVMQNMGKTKQCFEKGDKIAQLILERIDQTEIKDWSVQLDETERGKDGFGSTDAKVCRIDSPINSDNLVLSSNPYGPTITVKCKVKGNNQTLGLEFDEKDSKLTLINCKKGTPSARIPRWRSQLRGSILISINGKNVTKLSDVIQMIDAIQAEKTARTTDAELEFRTMEKVSIHPQKGVPQLYFDQLNIIAKHQVEIRDDSEQIAQYSEHNANRDDVSWEAQIRKLSCENDKSNIVHQIDAKVVEKLTRRVLMNRDDWNEWKLSEAKQLQQYEQQGMFSKPQPRPVKANILNLLWTYLIKADGTKKARCCCNGNPGRQGSITLAHTYAACVEQPAQRVYWGLVAIKNYIAIGADASNAFAEAPPPKAPLYVLVDRPYREWYKEKYNIDVPKGSVLRVNHAIQGHPEAPRLWSMFIDDIIQNKLNFQPTTHEQCLYRGLFNGKEVLFLRQVDDFSVAAADEDTCNKVIEKVSEYLKAPLKNLGRVNRFNGVQVEQTHQYVKLHNEAYIEKILRKHGWFNDSYTFTKRPVPMRSDNKYLHELENAKGPLNDKDKISLELKMKFNYRQALGEILYAMVTCRPDISISVTKLSQYSQNPAEIHYIALKNVFRYLRTTKNDGLIFWRNEKADFSEMAHGDIPQMYSDSAIQKELTETESIPKDQNAIHGYVDSDWAGDTSHRRSMSGMAIMFAGSVIAYKSRIQKTIALSSTEAEFVAACDAGKTILYLRTILDEMGIDQSEATVLFEDNQGALMMANAQQPTRRTRHIETATFALQDWVARDLISLHYIASHNNSSDGMTKPLARILFYKHFDRLMGRVIPSRLRMKKEIAMSTRKEHKKKNGEKAEEKEEDQPKEGVIRR